MKSCSKKYGWQVRVLKANTTRSWWSILQSERAKGNQEPVLVVGKDVDSVHVIQELPLTERVCVCANAEPKTIVKE